MLVLYLEERHGIHLARVPVCDVNLCIVYFFDTTLVVLFLRWVVPDDRVLEDIAHAESEQTVEVHFATLAVDYGTILHGCRHLVKEADQLVL